MRAAALTCASAARRFLGAARIGVAARGRDERGLGARLIAERDAHREDTRGGTAQHEHDS